MKLIIDIPEWKYKSICEGVEASKRCGVVGIDPDIHEAIYNGKPYEETPQGDLISRSALKIAIREATYGFEEIPIRVDKGQEIIDNAPAVENITVFTESPDEKAIADLKEELQKIIAEKRPKGKWITQEGYDGDEYYECSVCKDAFVLMDGTPKENNYNYCPNCGADMRGEKE